MQKARRQNREQTLPSDQRPKRLGILKLKKPRVQLEIEAALAQRQAGARHPQTPSHPLARTKTPDTPVKVAPETDMPGKGEPFSAARAIAANWRAKQAAEQQRSKQIGSTLQKGAGSSDKEMAAPPVNTTVEQYELWKTVGEKLTPWIQRDINDDQETKNKLEQIGRLYESVRSGTSTLAVSETGNVQINIISGDAPPLAFVNQLNSAGIAVVMPAVADARDKVTALSAGNVNTATYEAGPGLHTTDKAKTENRATNSRLRGTDYRDQLLGWFNEGFSTESAVRAKVVEKIKSGLASRKEFTLNLTEIFDLSSPPPMPQLGTKVKVRQNQFPVDALESLRNTGVEVITIPSTGAEAKVKPLASTPQALPKGESVPGIKAKDFASPDPTQYAPATSSSAQQVSAKKISFQRRLEIWTSMNSDEKAARKLAADKILTWMGKHHSNIWTPSETKRQKPVLVLDLSAESDNTLKFSSMPPIPPDVPELIVKNQNIREVNISTLPETLKVLRLNGNPLTDIQDENLPESFKSLTVELGATTLAPRIVRKLTTENRWPSYIVFAPPELPSDSAGRKVTKYTYEETWRAIMPNYQAYIDNGGEEMPARREAIERLEEWVHGDNGEHRGTPLELKNLGLSELPPVWPHGVKITSIDAKGNRLKEIPLTTLPPNLKFLDLSKNLISAMPPELTTSQMNARGTKRFGGMATSPADLASQLNEMGIKLNDLRAIDPRERNHLIIILNGNPLPEEVGKEYEAREFGPSYIFSEQALNDLKEAMKNDPEASFFQGH